MRIINIEEIIIAKAGKPIMKLTPMTKKKERKMGLLKGKMFIAGYS